MLRLKRLIMIFLCGFLLLIGIVVGANLWIDRSSNSAVYYNDSIPHQRVGVVLGCAPYLIDGRKNLFFSYRIQAAVKLFNVGKVDFLLVSGDNSRSNYDEPSAMKAALVELGIPEEKIVLDYAGFSTLDSVVRANKVFGLESFTIISQEFHVRRAIFIGKSHGITITGFVAHEVRGNAALKIHLREYLARVKAVLDVTILDREPKYLGEPVVI